MMMESLYPHNTSMAQEFARLFIAVAPNQFASRSSGSERGESDDFSSNGIDSEYCPELSWPSSLPLAMPSRTASSPLSSPLSVSSWASSRTTLMTPFSMSSPTLGGHYTPPTRVVKARPKKVVKKSLTQPSECAFCRNNGEEEPFYRSHVLKNSSGLVTCPILRRYTCPICKSTGELAHTIKYCPFNKDGDLMMGSMLKTSRTSTGRRKKSV